MVETLNNLDNLEINENISRNIPLLDTNYFDNFMYQSVPFTNQSMTYFFFS